MKSDIYHSVQEIRAPKDQDNARLCDRYYDGSKFMVTIKSSGKTRLVSLRYFIRELTKGIPPKYYN